MKRRDYVEPPSSKITKFQDAISAVQTFLDSKGYSEEATRVASSMNQLTCAIHCASLNSARQSTIF